MKYLTTLALLVFSTISTADESIFVYDFDMYVRYSYNGDTVMHSDADKNEGVGVGLTTGYSFDEDWAVIGSATYNIGDEEFDHAFGGVMYRGVSVTHGKQTMPYEMYMLGDFSQGLGSPMVGKHVGGGVQENSVKVFYSDDRFSIAYAQSLGTDQVQDSLSFGVSYKITDDLTLWYADVDITGQATYLVYQERVGATAGHVGMMYEQDNWKAAISREKSVVITPLFTWETESVFISGEYTVSDKLTLSGSAGYRWATEFGSAPLTTGVAYEAYDRLIVSGEYRHDIIDDRWNAYELKVRYEL